MKKILMISGLIIIALFLVACARQTDNSAFAGQAVSSSSTYIMKGDYFALSDNAVSSDSSGKIHLYQYKGADAPTNENAKIRLKDIETGYTIELDYVYQGYAGGIKGGSLLKVGLYQPYAGGIDESKDYYLLLRDPQSSSKVDSPLIVSFDSDGKEKLPLKGVTLKI